MTTTTSPATIGLYVTVILSDLATLRTAFCLGQRGLPTWE